jgi:fructose-bisphosphate aldolase class 1
VLNTDIARQMVAGDKGLLAIDDSIPTCDRRFAALSIRGGHETNRAAAQQALLHRAPCNRSARRGEYEAAMEQI